MEHLFQEFSIKASKGTDFSGYKYIAYNIIENEHCMKCYWKFWKDRNDKLYDEEVQRKRIIEWQQKEQIRDLEGQHSHVRKCAIEKKLDTETCTTEHIRRCIYVLKN